MAVAYWSCRSCLARRSGPSPLLPARGVAREYSSRRHQEPGTVLWVVAPSCIRDHRQVGFRATACTVRSARAASSNAWRRRACRFSPPPFTLLRQLLARGAHQLLPPVARARSAGLSFRTRPCRAPEKCRQHSTRVAAAPTTRRSMRLPNPIDTRHARHVGNHMAPAGPKRKC